MDKTSGYTMSIEKSETAPLAFFRYRQNNPRGVFNNTDRVGIVVIVEASSAAQADAMAVARTDGEVYFDGVHTHGDCRCCGERSPTGPSTR